MSETTFVEEQQLPTEPIAPVVETAAEVPPPAPVELRYEYQPTDENGLPMGGKQVIKYHTMEELVEKIRDQNIMLQRKWREETRKNRLGISTDETIPETAPRFAAPVEFKRGDLTQEQRVQLSRSILDPEKFEEVADGLFEHAMGAKPEVVRSLLTDIQQERLQAKARVEADAFVALTPEYVKCDSNFESITGWMVKHRLEPLRQNFRLAFDTLKAAGVLIVNEPVTAPVEPTAVVAPPPAPVEPVVVVPPAAAPPAPSMPGLPSGLNREHGAADQGNTRSLGDEIVYEVKDPRTGRVVRTLTGMAAVNAMPSEEMKRRLKNPAFSRIVDKLEAEAAARRVGIPSTLDR
jgi:hypothetical protein